MKNILFGVSTKAVIAYVIVCIGLYFLQSHLIYFPQPRSVSDPKYTMNLPAADANIIVTKFDAPGEKAIIYLGGNAEDVSLNLLDFKNQFPEFALYLMHYRGYGGSTGSPSEEDIYQDVLRLYEEVKKSHQDVTVIGRSLGTGFAVHLASERPIKKLVLITPYDSIETIASQNYPFIPVKLLLREKFNSYLFAKNVNVPTTILMAEHDSVIPASSTKNLHQHFPAGTATIVVIEGVGHNDISLDSSYYPILRSAI